MPAQTDKEIVYNLHQVEHILNDLMSGGRYDGRMLDSDKLLNYKFAIIQLLDKHFFKPQSK